MATITDNGSKNHHKFTLEITEKSYNVDNNSSEVEFTFKIEPITSGYNWSGWGSSISYTITINGTNYTGTIPSYNGSSTVTLKSGTQTVSHNNDGSKTIDYSFSVTDGANKSYTCGNASASGTFALTTIPRASTVSSISGGTIGQTLTVNINRSSSSFTHTVTVTYASYSQTISTNAGTSASATLNMAFCNQITSSTTAQAVLTLITYNGTTVVGRTDQLFTITVPSSVVPTISSVTKTDTAGYLATYSAYVQGKSNLRVQTSASGSYGSTISSYTIYIKRGSTTLRTMTTNDFTISNISYTGTLTIQVSVKDSRGRTSTTNSSTITVAAYSNPVATMTAERRNNDATVTLTWNASITNINNNNVNSKSFNIYKRQKGTSSWGSAIYSKTDGYTYSSTGSTTSCDADYAWEFKIVAEDSFTPTTYQTEIGTVFELINWGADGNSMAIGKVATDSNTLDVALATKMTTLDTSGDVNVDGDVTTSNSFIIPRLSNEGIKDEAGNILLSSYSNNNVVVNAGGGNLFLGYQNTGNLNFLNGKYLITSDRIIYTDKPTNANAQGRFILVPFTSFRQFGTSGTQAYLEALIKWIVTTYPQTTNGVFIGGGESGSRGSYMLHIYDTNDTDSSGFPKYSSGVWFSLDKSETIRFGTGTYTYSQQVLARTSQIPSVTTGNGTATKSSGNGTMTAVSYSKYGNVVTLTLTFNNSGSATSTGSNIWVGTISGVSLPKAYASGCGYFSSSGYMAELDSSGDLTIRVIGGQSAASNTSARRVTMTYVCA